ncbi:MAG: hypothetical protein M1383_04780 [Patescibacteria group bacterium]|nr:hypothetical protein [Patescibacteria group bacterium]
MFLTVIYVAIFVVVAFSQSNPALQPNNMAPACIGGGDILLVGESSSNMLLTICQTATGYVVVPFGYYLAGFSQLVQRQGQVWGYGYNGWLLRFALDKNGLQADPNMPVDMWKVPNGTSMEFVSNDEALLHTPNEVSLSKVTLQPNRKSETETVDMSTAVNPMCDFPVAGGLQNDRFCVDSSQGQVWRVPNNTFGGLQYTRAEVFFEQKGVVAMQADGNKLYLIQAAIYDYGTIPPPSITTAEGTYYLSQPPKLVSPGKLLSVEINPDGSRGRVAVLLPDLQVDYNNFLLVRKGRVYFPEFVKSGDFVVHQLVRYDVATGRKTVVVKPSDLAGECPYLRVGTFLN